MELRIARICIREIRSKYGLEIVSFVQLVFNYSEWFVKYITALLSVVTLEEAKVAAQKKAALFAPLLGFNLT